MGSDYKLLGSNKSEELRVVVTSCGELLEGDRNEGRGRGSCELS